VTFEDFPVSSLMDITPRPELVFVSGEGSWLTDHAGQHYLDFVQGWAVNSLGHSPRVIVDALAAQAPKLITPSPAFYNQPKTVGDMVDHIVARMLDQFGIHAAFAKRWDGEMHRRPGARRPAKPDEGG